MRKTAYVLLALTSLAASATGQGIADGNTRYHASRSRLVILWDFTAIQSDAKLTFPEALAWIRGADTRPLLVARDSDEFEGEDGALLSEHGQNDKTILLSHFFHCVKLSRYVTNEKHPLHSLFRGPRPPHFFLATWDGKTILPFRGKQSSNALWGAMRRVLRADYVRDPTQVVDRWLRLLDKYDALQRHIEELQKQKRAQGERGRDKRVASLARQIEKAEKQLEEAQDVERKMLAVGLKRAPKTKSLEEIDFEAAAAVRAGKGGLIERVRKEREKEKERYGR